MDLRARATIILLMTILVIAVWTYPQWRSLTVGETVVEAFPGLAMDQQANFLGIPPAEREAYLDLQEEEPRLALDLVRGRLQAPSSAPEDEFEFDDEGWTLIRRGNFVEIDPIRRAEGSVFIYESADLSRLVRLEDFTTLPGPDLRVILTRDPDPRDVGAVGPDYIDLGELKGTTGPQNYTLDAAIDLNRYLAVAIFSERNQLVMSVATLR